ncbi:hypothetical protein [Olleya namhaensis]|uniref:hypothetical protein n=1 Tax=Olleya namhaensis TaxID=1144750 RepID=UPI002492BE1B|nr:hypothetical protein [Olleya namhaensis]
MKNLLLTIVLLISVQISKAQNDTLYVTNSNQYHDYYKAYLKRVTFKIGGGVLLPQGKLQDYFGPSPVLELSLDFPVTKTKSLELALQFVIPDQKQSFLFVRTTDTIQAKASFMFNPMLRFKKNLSQNVNSQLHLSLGVGASVIKTDARNPFYTGDNQDSEKYEVVTAFLMAPALDFVKKFRSNEELTFSLGLNYSPYKIEGALQENIGGISLIPRIRYSF